MLVRGLPLIALVILLLIALTGFRAFRSVDYWFELVHGNFAMMLLTFALTPIILTGGIDLSVGSTTVLVSVLIGALWHELNWPLPWALAGGVAAGLVCGCINGLFIARGLWPLIATLATRELYRGLALSCSSDPPVSGFPAPYGTWWREPLLGLPVPFWIVIAVGLLVAFLVHHTWIGRSCYAMGDNEQAAIFSGLPVRSVKFGLYALAGLLAGVAGAAAVLEYDSARADADKSLELAAITCVVLGGVRITGGHGTLLGVVLGIVTLTLLHGILLAVAPEWRDVLTGVLLIGVAVVTCRGRHLS